MQGHLRTTSDLTKNILFKIFRISFSTQDDMAVDVFLTSKRYLKSRLPLPWLFCHLQFLSCQSLLQQTPSGSYLLVSLSNHSQPRSPHSLFPPFPEPFTVSPLISAAVSPCPLKVPLQLHRFVLFFLLSYKLRVSFSFRVSLAFRATKLLPKLIIL